LSIWLLYLLLLRATVMSFSGFASVPIVREDLVEHREVLTDEQLNTAIALSQASPGPLGVYVVIVGYFVGGMPGAVAGMMALVTPAVLAVPILRIVRRGNASMVRGASSGIMIASSVLMLATSAQLAPEAIPTVPFALLATAGLVALATTRISPALVVILAVIAGLLVA
jgi:chromate transporter